MKQPKFMHALTGYYRDNNKRKPVLVNSEGYLIFKQDINTRSAISKFADSINAFVECLKKIPPQEEEEGAEL